MRKNILTTTAFPEFSRRSFLTGLFCAGLAVTVPRAIATQTLAADANTAKKPLVLYYSQSGNTKKVAEEIQRLTGAAILRIEPANAYPDNYKELVDYAKKEIEANARPEVKTPVPDMSQYSMIFLGYPNWWSTLPMPVCTFLEKAHLNDMIIAPFNTNGGGGLGHSVEDIKKLLPSCKVMNGLAISGASAGTAAANERVRKWLESMGVAAGK